ncbi:MAG: NAD(P)/FAD-dependent oxidoreductase [Eubacteriaceae bacterium]|nr:NAD(P)/FAD-dependent oxidoreductase [Eubacteriaceae bacterium]
MKHIVIIGGGAAGFNAALAAAKGNNKVTVIEAAF